MSVEDEMEVDGTTMELSFAISPPLSQDDSFVWDESSQLYYHARSGFYHDPVAGWYYSSKDGLYYKFEDGNYVLLDTKKCDQSEMYDYGEFGLNSLETQEEHVAQGLNHDSEYQCSVTEEEDKTNKAVSTSSRPAYDIPPPTSEWLEDTLIDMYLSGYKNLAPLAFEEMSSEREEIGNADDHEKAEEEGALWDEENWRAQYGQVIHNEEETMPEFPVVDIWDWGIIREPGKEGKFPVARLVGRLVQPSAKLHPSMPLGGGRLRTAPICEVHLDLVLVKSGQVYKLRSPSAEYLTTLLHYDSSNPTKDWGYPELSVGKMSIPSHSDSESRAVVNPLQTDKKAQAYRDRAAERRALHGGFGIGPGQKKTTIEGSSSSPPECSSEEAAAEALEMSLGAGSYAQKILKKMGWSEGEALGAAKQGITEPLTAVGNKGNAGLGWHHGRSKGS